MTVDDRVEEKEESFIALKTEAYNWLRELDRMDAKLYELKEGLTPYTERKEPNQLVGYPPGK